MTHDVDVVIVGAGFSGLAAAAALVSADRTVTVLEARERVGGRVESMLDGLGRRVDSGGQYLADEMLAIRGLAERFGASLVRNESPGDSITLPMECHDEWDYGEQFYEGLRVLHHADANVTFDSWVDGLEASECTKAAIRSTADGQMCLDHRSLGLAHVAHQLRRTPPLAEELQYSVEGTMHALAEQLAASLGDCVRLGAAVRRIDRHPGGLVVHTDGAAVRCRQVVMAVPPTAAAQLVFEPPLPDHLADALAGFRAGDVTKILVRYAQPFWHARGLDGTVRFNTPYGLYVADASASDAHALVMFVGGPLAATWRALGETARKEFAVQHLVNAFGDDAAAPIDVLVRDWPPDQWGGGGYCQFVTGLGEPVQIDVLMTGTDGVQFASTELAELFPGYIEGAVHAGRRAAQRTIDLLDDPPATSDLTK
jgi:monoamine oxidase